MGSKSARVTTIVFDPHFPSGDFYRLQGGEITVFKKEVPEYVFVRDTN